MTFLRTIRCLRLLSIAAITGCAAANADLIRIMPVGDSITVGSTSLDGQPYVPYQYGYRAGLYSRLTDAGYSFQFVGQSTEHPTASGASVDLAALGQDCHNGYGGQGISHIANNIASWMRADDPDVILLMIGINDITQGAAGHPTGLENSLRALAQTVTTVKPTAHLIIAQTIPYASYTDSIVQYNNYIKDTLVPSLSGQGKLITTVDQYSNMLTNGSIDPSLYSNGINHPTAVGYDRMAQTWFEGIQSLGEIVHAAGQTSIHAISDSNLLSDKPAVASSCHSESYTPAYATDGMLNDHVFADGGSDCRLVIHGIGRRFNLIRLWRNLSDANRVPAQVTIKCSASDTVSLDPASFETTLASTSALFFNGDGYVDIGVNAPADTQSLHLDFGSVDSLGQPFGIRISEVQAFMAAEPSTGTVLICGLLAMLGARSWRRTIQHY